MFKRVNGTDVFEFMGRYYVLFDKNKAALRIPTWISRPGWKIVCPDGLDEKLKLYNVFNGRTRCVLLDLVEGKARAKQRKQT